MVIRELVGGSEVSGRTGEWCHSSSGGLRHWSVRRSWDVLTVEKTAFIGDTRGLSRAGVALFLPHLIYIPVGFS